MCFLLRISIFYCLLIFAAADASNIFGSLSMDEFGYIKPQVTALFYCRGPKKMNCARGSYIANGDNFDNVTIMQDTYKTSQIKKIQLAVWAQKTPLNGKPDMVKAIEEPCKHFFLGATLNHYWNVDSKCVIRKGHYYVKNFNMTAVIDNMIGSKFFSGNFTIQAQVLAKDCNINCMIAQIVMEKDLKQSQ